MKEICLHDRYISEEMAGLGHYGMPPYYLQRMVLICIDCGQDISNLELLKK